MLSIILPNHKEENVHAFIEEIQSILPVSEIIVSNDTESKGKGWAIREALSLATGDKIAFLDADGDIEARMLLRLLPFLDDFDVVVGSKRITKSPLRRKVMTHVTRIWFRFLFGLKVDTQTGIKLFRRSALKALKYGWDSKGFVFDLEIISRLQAKGFRMVEVPVEVEIKKQLAFKTIFKMTWESACLKFRLLSRQK